MDVEGLNSKLSLTESLLGAMKGQFTSLLALQTKAIIVAKNHSDKMLEYAEASRSLLKMYKMHPAQQKTWERK